MAATGTPTPNIGLRIPIGTDPASVDDINYNSNLIDTKLGAVGSDSVQDQIDTLNSNLTNKINNLVKAISMSVQLDGNGNWSGWNYNLGYTNYQLLKAFVGSWNDVEVLGANNGFWSVKVTGLSNVTVNMTMIIAYAPNP